MWITLITQYSYNILYIFGHTLYLSTLTETFLATSLYTKNNFLEVILLSRNFSYQF